MTESWKVLPSSVVAVVEAEIREAWQEADANGWKLERLILSGRKIFYRLQEADSAITANAKEAKGLITRAVKRAGGEVRTQPRMKGYASYYVTRACTLAAETLVVESESYDDIAAFEAYLEHKGYTRTTIVGWGRMAARVRRVFPDDVPGDPEAVVAAVLPETLSRKSRQMQRTGIHRYCEYLDLKQGASA